MCIWEAKQDNYTAKTIIYSGEYTSGFAVCNQQDTAFDNIDNSVLSRIFVLFRQKNVSPYSSQYGIIREKLLECAVDRNKLAKLVLLLLALPFAAYILIDCIAGYIPPTESYKKTPYQFEAAFNEQMAKYGMSIDIDSVNFTYGDSLYKKAPVVCEDGSKITCTYYPTSERRKALLEYITFEQELTGQPSDKVYIEKLLKFLLDEFQPVMAEHKDETLNTSGKSYNEAMKICSDFLDSDEKEVCFFICSEQNHGRAVTLERNTDEEVKISVSLKLS